MGCPRVFDGQVHGLPIIATGSLWTVQGLVCPWAFHGQSMGASWIGHGHSMDCPWTCLLYTSPSPRDA
eukprot:271385-Lingulodinium_polyedra.AAC.1